MPRQALRSAPNAIFTGGVVEKNGIFSAAFCESMALRLAPSPSQSPSVTALPKGEPLAWRESFRQSRKLCRWERSPGGGAVAQRLRGFKSAEPEKTVKRSSRRTGVNLQFFSVQPTSSGLKGASSPFFVAPARRNRWHFSGSLLVSKENISRLHPLPLSPVPHGTIHFSAAAVGMRTVYSM